MKSLLIYILLLVFISVTSTIEIISSTCQTQVSGLIENVLECPRDSDRAARSIDEMENNLLAASEQKFCCGPPLNRFCCDLAQKQRENPLFSLDSYASKGEHLVLVVAAADPPHHGGLLWATMWFVAVFVVISGLVYFFGSVILLAVELICCCFHKTKNKTSNKRPYRGAANPLDNEEETLRNENSSPPSYEAIV